MRVPTWIILLLTQLVMWCPAAPAPEAVAILYNSAVPESKRLADFYCAARNIPEANLIGLDMPDRQDISRADYEKYLLRPLREEFDRREWWMRSKDTAGIVLPVSNQIRVLVLMRGVPLRIQPLPKDAKAKSQAVPVGDPIGGRDEAAVDSELAMFGVEGLPVAGVLENKFYKATRPLTDFPYLILTARIDAPSYGTCERMIRDAVDVEKTGLWGMAYVDIANKFPQGDGWLEMVARENRRVGIPCVVDRFNETFPKNYPMTAAAVYFGWYDWHVSGPLLRQDFRFRKGAVAAHLHSFSAEQLRHAGKNWCGPILERGAAVTLGNVYEPYLHLTHDFGMVHRNVLNGDCWVEACWKAMPVTSWQGVVLGDPLYRPYRHLDGTGEVVSEDRPFRALRAAMLEWPTVAVERRKQLDKAAERMKSGIMAEAAGLDFLQEGLTAEAILRFRLAKRLFVGVEDKLRQDFHIIAMDRAANRKSLALRGLRDAQMRYGPVPVAESLQVWVDLLDPPPTPPAKKPAGTR